MGGLDGKRRSNGIGDLVILVCHVYFSFPNACSKNGKSVSEYSNFLNIYLHINGGRHFLLKQSVQMRVQQTLFGSLVVFIEEGVTVVFWKYFS